MKTVIIGCSIAGHTVANLLRAENPQASITIISDEAYPLYDRRKLLDYWAGKLKEKELFLSSFDAYQQQAITFLKDCKAVAVNPSRRTVSYKKDDARQSIEYDYLVIASGRRTERPDIEGINKTGVFTFDSLADFKELKSCVTEDAVCLLGKNPFVEKISALLTSRGIEVKLFPGTPQEGVLADSPETGTPPDQEPAAASDSTCAVEEINSEIVEIIGESGVQAIKLKEGKIIGVSWVGLTLPLQPNIDFLKDTGIELAHGAIAVDEAMRTSFANIFACGSVCLRRSESPRQKTWEEVEAEAMLVVGQLIQV